MTHSRSQGKQLQALLDRTNWASLATASGTGESLPTALTLLTSPDPLIRESALQDALEPVTHQNSIYEATTPVALYIAAILDHPAVTAADYGQDATTPRPRATLVRLLAWLGDTAYDANDESVAIGESGEMRAFRDARPAIFSAVRALLGHEDADVRHNAVVAAIPLIEHPLLTEHQAALAGHTRRLLATSTDRRHRDRVLDALRAWGHDTSGLENATDIAAGEHYALLRAARASWEGGYSEAPPF
ncbi:hypothetical protein EDE04_3713 [Streptomyces sp. 2132.2]|uniref:hypothetical protein n=1 Tax=Streptomyces sp. 2132.2 TaxID=2485161 RepID=UPI000F4A0985|nr:hypothetical protein [Streptomyces sp. 2132.2]ROQ97220.1 hypothetical protein EDE04_3713 [Streptomyces sp. 2132.2]